ncbi:MAG: hypothetical protein AAF126_17915, partial [Chloroflexota bacterium]
RFASGYLILYIIIAILYHIPKIDITRKFFIPAYKFDERVYYQSGNAILSCVIFLIFGFTVFLQFLNLSYSTVNLVIVGQFLVFICGCIQFWLLISDNVDRERENKDFRSIGRNQR